MAPLQKRYADLASRCFTGFDPRWKKPIPEGKALAEWKELLEKRFPQRFSGGTPFVLKIAKVVKDKIHTNERMIMLKRMPSDPPPQRASLGAQMRVDAGRCGQKAAYRQLTGSVLAFYWQLTGSLLAAYIARRCKPLSRWPAEQRMRPGGTQPSNDGNWTRYVKGAVGARHEQGI